MKNILILGVLKSYTLAGPKMTPKRRSRVSAWSIPELIQELSHPILDYQNHVPQGKTEKIIV